MKYVKQRPIPDESGSGCTPIDCSDGLRRFLFEIPPPWKVDSATAGGNSVDIDKVIHINLVYPDNIVSCPLCGTPSKVHDRKYRTWRDMDMGDSACFIHAMVPRVRCPKYEGIRQIPVSWADRNVTYTRRFAQDAIRRMANRVGSGDYSAGCPLWLVRIPPFGGTLL